MTTTTQTMREAWLQSAVAEVRDLFAASGSPLPAKIRVACGFPPSYNRTKAVSQCWLDTASADKTVEICVAPTLAQPVDVLAALLRALCRAVPGGYSGKSASYQAALSACALDKKGRMPQFNKEWGEMLASLGAYPHAELVVPQSATQGTRQIKLICPTCGYILRTSAKWIATGLPQCHDGDMFNIAADEVQA